MAARGFAKVLLIRQTFFYQSCNSRDKSERKSLTDITFYHISIFVDT